MNEREYNECVHNYSDNIFRFILKNIRHEEDAKDIVQSTFEKVWNVRESVEVEKSKSFLFTVAYNQMIDHIRKSKRIQLKESFTDSTKVHHMQINNAKKILNEALNRLSEQNRTLVLLKDYEGYSYAEIGEITALNESQVKVYLHRARLQLRDYLVKPENVI